MPNIDPVPYPPPSNAVPILKTLYFSPAPGEDKVIKLELTDYVPYPKATMTLYYNGAPVKLYNNSYDPSTIAEKFFGIYDPSGQLKLTIYANQSYLAPGYRSDQPKTAYTFRLTDQFVFSYTFYQKA